MKALIWKEVRALRRPAYVVLALMAVTGPVQLWYEGTHDITGGLVTVLWWIALPLVALGLGCHLIARDRARGELPFGSSWPASKGQVWAAKLVVGLSVLVLIYAALLAFTALAETRWFYRVLLGTEGQGTLPVVMRLPWLWPHAAGCLILFGLGLMLSTIRTAPFDAMLLASLSTMLLAVGVYFVFFDFVPRMWGPTLGCYPMDFVSAWIPACIGGVLLGAVCIGASWFGATRSLPLGFGRRHWSTLGLLTPLGALAVVGLIVGVRVLGEPTEDDFGHLMWARVSPDGKWVSIVERAEALYNEGAAFVGSGRWRLWLMRSDGSGLRCIARSPVRAAEWSPDSRWIAIGWGTVAATFFPGGDAGRWCWLWDMQSMALRKVPRGPGHKLRDWSCAAVIDLSSSVKIEFSPHGKYLYLTPEFVRLGGGLDIVAAELAKSAELVGWGQQEAEYYYVLRSGDQQRMALWSGALPSGGNLRKLAEAPDGNVTNAAVSPDGRWVAWELSRPSRHEGEGEWGCDVVVESLATGRRVELAHRWISAQPWSPDGKYFWCHGNEGISIVALDEEMAVRELGREMLDGDRPGFDNQWSPDGKQCAFMTLRRVERDERKYLRWVALWVAKADGSDLRKVADNPDPAAWPQPQLAGWTDQCEITVCEQDRRLVVIDPDTGERSVIFEREGMGNRE